VEDGAAAHLIQ